MKFLIATLILINTTLTLNATPLRVVSTTGMIHDLVVQIAGNLCESSSLMASGVDPHLYKATIGDLKRLRRANIIFYNGLHLEARLGKVLDHMGEKSIAVSRDIKRETLILVSTKAKLYDPHIWLDVSLWQQAAHTIAKALQKVLPGQHTRIETNLHAYQKKLSKLDQTTRDRMMQIPAHRRILVTAHDAFAYFGRRYGVTVKGLQGISTEAKAGTRDVRDLVTYVIKNAIPTIFIESTLSPRNVLAVIEGAEAKGWSVRLGGQLLGDAMGPANTSSGTYLGMVQHNVKTIFTGLTAQQALLAKHTTLEN